MIRKILLGVFIFVFAVMPVFSAPRNHYYYEKEYQEVWASKNNGVTEFVLPDRARVDCVTEEYAIEFDFAKKWGESIGQALYYAVALNKKAGIVLIVEDSIKDQKYVDRVNAVAKTHDIKVWTMTPEDMPKITTAQAN
ncbi:MAG: hypothetical protein R3Y28_08625 [Candidatus Gastranaerophilales bacterium]